MGPTVGRATIMGTPLLKIPGSMIDCVAFLATRVADVSGCSGVEHCARDHAPSREFGSRPACRLRRR